MNVQKLMLMLMVYISTWIYYTLTLSSEDLIIS